MATANLDAARQQLQALREQHARENREEYERVLADLAKDFDPAMAKFLVNLLCYDRPWLLGQPQRREGILHARDLAYELTQAASVLEESSSTEEEIAAALCLVERLHSKRLGADNLTLRRRSLLAAIDFTAAHANDLLLSEPWKCKVLLMMFGRVFDLYGLDRLDEKKVVAALKAWRSLQGGGDTRGRTSKYDAVAALMIGADLGRVKSSPRSEFAGENVHTLWYGRGGVRDWRNWILANNAETVIDGVTIPLRPHNWKT